MSSVLVTGANGFIGSRLCQYAASKCLKIVKVSRNFVDQDWLNIGEIGPETDWTRALKGIDSIVHLAARVHVVKDKDDNPISAFRRINVDGAINLARQAAEYGVRRFIFISSIKVNGESTQMGSSFRPDDVPNPQDPYAASKSEAEQALRRLALKTGMEVVIIRPPLVYGPGVQANFRTMMCWLYKGIPLPFGAIHNKRSLVAIDNLVELIEKCLYHPAAANEIFLVSDGEDLSTTKIMRYLASGMGRKAFLLSVPQSMLYKALTLLGRRNIASRLCGSLQVDISKTQEVLGWKPSVTVEQALCRTAQAFLEEKKVNERF